jgi:glycosyltransferase involved in cell wall biosynthesis
MEHTAAITVRQERTRPASASVDAGRAPPHSGSRRPAALDIVVDEPGPAPWPLRMAVVTETYPPEHNGVAQTLARTVQHLRARRHRVQLIRPRQHACELAHESAGYEEVLVTGIPVSIPVSGVPPLTLGWPALSHLRSLWAHQPPQVVLVVTEGPLGWAAVSVAKELGIPVVTEFHTRFDLCSRHYGLGWMHGPIQAYLRAFHRRAGRTLVATERLRQHLLGQGVQQVQVVPRAVDSQQFHPQHRSAALRHDWQAGAAGLVVMCVSRLAPEKNLGAVCDAFQAIQIQVRGALNARLVFVGEGPEQAALQRRCPDAVFAGWRTGDDLAAHYASADLFLFPSLSETYGAVVPEAMASGLPVVAYNLAAAGELIRQGWSGLLAPPDQHHEFVRLAVRAARDRTQTMVMGARARARAERLDRAETQGAIEAALLQAARQVVQPIGPVFQPSAWVG